MPFARAGGLSFCLALSYKGYVISPSPRRCILSPYYRGADKDFYRYYGIRWGVCRFLWELWVPTALKNGVIFRAKKAYPKKCKGINLGG